MFWPFAYEDISEDIFWGKGYGPFWDYGYGDIFGGLFSPYGFDDLAGYLPSQGAASDLPSQLGQMCGSDTKEVAGWPIERIQQLISPDDQQRLALNDLASASVKAAQSIRSACPKTVSFTPSGRLDAMQTRLEAMAQAIESVREPVERFYAGLSDEQKARFDAANQTAEQQEARARGSVVQNCNAVNAATQWPAAEIEKAVHPTKAQQSKLDALKTAVDQAADRLGAACPSELPATPPARLAAIAKRVDAMLQAVKDVRAPLDDFYSSLDDEQKAQFNMIGRLRAMRQ